MDLQTLLFLLIGIHLAQALPAISLRGTETHVSKRFLSSRAKGGSVAALANPPSSGHQTPQNYEFKFRLPPNRGVGNAVTGTFFTSNLIELFVKAYKKDTRAKDYSYLRDAEIEVRITFDSSQSIAYDAVAMFNVHIGSVDFGKHYLYNIEDQRGMTISLSSNQVELYERNLIQILGYNRDEPELEMIED